MKKFQITHIFTILLACIAATPIASYGNVVVHDSLGPSFSASSSSWWIGTLVPTGYHDIVAGAFIPTVSGSLDELWAAVSDGGTTKDLVISLTEDNSGTPGATLWQQSVSASLLGSSGTVLNVSGLNGPSLTAGTLYWLLFDVPSSTSSSTGIHSVWTSEIGDMTGFLLKRDSVWETKTGNPAMKIAVSSVPIPAAIWLFGSGLLSLVGIARCKKA